MRNDLLNSGIFIHENSVDFEKIFEQSYLKWVNIYSRKVYIEDN